MTNFLHYQEYLVSRGDPLLRMTTPRDSLEAHQALNGLAKGDASTLTKIGSWTPLWATST